MSWHNKIKEFLEQDRRLLIIGFRTKAWGRSFQKDLVRWKFPVDLSVAPPTADGRLEFVLVKKKGIK